MRLWELRKANVYKLQVKRNINGNKKMFCEYIWIKKINKSRCFTGKQIMDDKEKAEGFNAVLALIFFLKVVIKYLRKLTEIRQKEHKPEKKKKRGYRILKRDTEKPKTELYRISKEFWLRQVSKF